MNSKEDWRILHDALSDVSGWCIGIGGVGALAAAIASLRWAAVWFAAFAMFGGACYFAAYMIERRKL